MKKQLRAEVPLTYWKIPCAWQIKPNKGNRIIPGCLCLWPLWSTEELPLRVPNATLQSAERPSSTSKARARPRPCRFSITISLRPQWPCTSLPASSLSGAPLPLRWYLGFVHKMSLMNFLVHLRRCGRRVRTVITNFPVAAFLCVVLRLPSHRSFTPSLLQSQSLEESRGESCLSKLKMHWSRLTPGLQTDSS